MKRLIPATLFAVSLAGASLLPAKPASALEINIGGFNRPPVVAPRRVEVSQRRWVARKWVAGYWERTAHGRRWVPGHWVEGHYDR